MNKINIENKLIEKAKQNDKSAWSKLFEENYSYLHTFVNNRLSEKSVVDEILSNTWLAAYKYIYSFNENLNTSFRTWLCNIGRNQISRYYQNSNKNNIVFRKLILTAQFSSEDNLNQEIIFDYSSTGEAFNKLPNNYKEILQLLYMDGFSHKETSEILESNEQATRALAYRAKKALKELLNSKGDLNE